MSEPKVLLTGLGIPESPRWHEGRLWFCNWIERQVVAVGLDGKARSGQAPAGSRWPASPRAAKSCNASNCPRTGPRSR